MDQTERFEAERSRLVVLASRLLRDSAEAEDIVQQAWLRMYRTDVAIECLPAWLTTVTTRLCLDRLRSPVPTPVKDTEFPGAAGEDPSGDAALAESVGFGLHVVLDRLSPRERVAFVLHDSFGLDFATIAEALQSTPAATRKLASRARAKVLGPRQEERLASWEVVDAFLAAAKGGDLDRLLRLLAPDVVVTADHDAVLVGTPRRLEGRHAVATFFNGGAQGSLPVYLDDRPGSAWFHRGEPRVVFDFRVGDGLVQAITFRAAPDALARVLRRAGGGPRC